MAAPGSRPVADPVLRSTDGTVGRITINRPEVKNAINLDAIHALIAALEHFNAQPGVRAVVLQGAAGDLSSGGDIQDMLARRGKAVATTERLKQGFARIVQTMASHEKPIVARVDGDALGAGAALALASDFLLATKKSRLGFPFVKVGLVPDTGSSYVLPRIVGLQLARRLLLTGDPVGAEEAASMGLVTQLVPDTAALDAAERALTEKLAALPATAVRDAKRLLWQNLDVPLLNALTQEAFLQGIRFTTPEHAAATDAFLARRTAK